MSTNHVDGEIYIPARVRERARQMGLSDELIDHAVQAGLKIAASEKADARVPVEPTGLDYRAAALHAAVNHYRTEIAHTDHVIYAAQKFEHYLRTGQTP